MTAVKSFAYSIRLTTTDTNIWRVYWTTERKMFVVFRNSRRYEYDKISLHDFLDFVAKGEQAHKWRDALDFLIKWRKPEYRELSVEEYKEIT